MVIVHGIRPCHTHDQRKRLARKNLSICRRYMMCWNTATAALVQFQYAVEVQSRFSWLESWDCLTRSIWKMLGPFATTSRLTPIQQMSLAVLSRAACASMSTTTSTTTTRDRGDRYGPMECAQRGQVNCWARIKDFWFQVECWPRVDQRYNASAGR